MHVQRCPQAVALHLLDQPEGLVRDGEGLGAAPERSQRDRDQIGAIGCVVVFAVRLEHALPLVEEVERLLEPAEAVQSPAQLAREQRSPRRGAAAEGFEPLPVGLRGSRHVSAPVRDFTEAPPDACKLLVGRRQRERRFVGVLPCRLELPPAEDVAEVEPSGDGSAPKSAALLPAAGSEARVRGRTGVFAQPAGFECGEPVAGHGLGVGAQALEPVRQPRLQRCSAERVHFRQGGVAQERVGQTHAALGLRKQVGGEQLIDRAGRSLGRARQGALGAGRQEELVARLGTGERDERDQATRRG